MSHVVVRLEIRGLVQGVGYRWSMAQEAGPLGITGWVRNRGDGSVEATVAGPQQEVDRLVAWARRGPPSALVQTVDLFPGDGTYTTFEQRPTA